MLLPPYKRGTERLLRPSSRVLRSDSTCVVLNATTTAVIVSTSSWHAFPISAHLTGFCCPHGGSICWPCVIQSIVITLSRVACLPRISSGGWANLIQTNKHVRLYCRMPTHSSLITTAKVHAWPGCFSGFTLQHRSDCFSCLTLRSGPKPGIGCPLVVLWGNRLNGAWA